jgi:predicted nucleotide-binding protein
MDSKIHQIETLIQEGEKFTFENFSVHDDHDRQFGGQDSPAWLTWRTRVPYVVKQLANAGSAPVQVCIQATLIQTAGYRKDKFELKKDMFMKALKETLGFVHEDVFGEAGSPEAVPKSVRLSNRIFVVHGHDDQLKTDLELFLKNLGLEPIVLHRQPDQGNTLIEKFEKHADVGFAFVLFTPDEVAYTVDQLSVDDGSRKKEFRARPNVIFEFGFFVGKLGRARVCGLLKGKVTRPSDMDGLVYKDASNGIEPLGWNLIKELKAAGYDVKV